MGEADQEYASKETNWPVKITEAIMKKKDKRWTSEKVWLFPRRSGKLCSQLHSMIGPDEKEPSEITWEEACLKIQEYVWVLEEG